LKADCKKRARDLLKALDDARAEARDQQGYSVLRLHAIGLADVLEAIPRDCVAAPPDVEAAMQRIGGLLEARLQCPVILFVSDARGGNPPAKLRISESPATRRA
jgi:hypothetical protein